MFLSYSGMVSIPLNKFLSISFELQLLFPILIPPKIVKFSGNNSATMQLLLEDY